MKGVLGLIAIPHSKLARLILFIISFGGNQKPEEECDENWWTQIYNNEDDSKNNTCFGGLTCKDNKCSKVTKKVDSIFL